jgi:urea transport system permease protein
MAMFLKLEASDPESTKIQSTPGIPDFMDWNQITELPLLWQPFHSFRFTLVAVIAVPVLLAFIIGMALFKRRVGDVYPSSRRRCADPHRADHRPARLTGGVNGITDLKTLLGWDLRTDSAKLILYFINAGLLFGCIFIGRFIQPPSSAGCCWPCATRRTARFSGYDVASFKIFVFCVAAAFSAIGGAMFALQVGFMSPSFVGIVPSIEMVIFAAVGGRMSLLGAVYGALLVNYGKTYFSESFPELWLYLMGGLFIAVVMYFPNGLAGLWDSHGRQALAKLLRRTPPWRKPRVPRPKPKSWSQP